MGTTDFTSGTIITSEWLNEVDEFVFGLASTGGVGDGTTDDTDEIQALLDAGKDVYLSPGKTYLITGLTITTSNQKLYGPGYLKISGTGNGVSLSGGITGVILDLNFNSSTQTAGWAVHISDAHRTEIRRLNIVDGFSGVYIEGANTTRIEFMWASLRGAGIKWYGNDTTRSDILFLDNVIIDAADDAYGLDWDGNCHSLEVKYCGLVGSLGFIIRNTDGSTTFPAIGRIGHIEVDYSTGHGVEIQAGLDYDFVMPYVLGSTGDGFRIAATINDYEVRITGGKSIGNGGYGINNLGGILLFSGNTTTYDNTSGNFSGDIWTVSPMLALDATANISIQSNNPVFAFDTNDYMSYDRTNNVLVKTFGAVNGFSEQVSGGDPELIGDTNDYLVYDRTNNVWRFFVGGVASLTIGDDLGNYADDATAEANGVPLYGFYRTAGAVKQRVA